MPVSWNSGLIFLSFMVAFAGSFTAFSQAQRMRSSTGRARGYWLLVGGITLAMAVWSMHFIGMLAFDLPVKVAYDLDLTVLSLLPAVAAGLLGFYILGFKAGNTVAVVAGGFVMGLGIAAMHYIGMAALKMSPAISYSPPVVVASVLIAIVAAIGALLIIYEYEKIRCNQIWYQIAGSFVMGLAMTGMHYTAMAGARYAVGSMCKVGGSQIPGSLLVVVVTGGVFLLFGIGMIATIFDQQLTRQKTLKLAAEHTLLRGVIDSIPDLIFFKDRNGAYLGCNKAFEGFFGVGEGEVAGKKDMDFFSATNLGAFQQSENIIRDCAAEDVNEVWLIGSDGRRNLFEMHSVAFALSDNVMGMIGVLHNITMRKLVEEDLLRRERDFRLLAENIPDHLMRFDLSGRVQYVKPATARMLGFEPEALKGRPLRESVFSVQDSASEAFEGKLYATMRTGRLTEIEMPVQHPTEGAQVHNVRFIAERDDRGGIISVLAIGRDMTVQKNAQIELVEREHRYREIFDNISDNLYTLEVTGDGRYRYLDVNPAFKCWYGVTRAGMVGRYVGENMSEEARRWIGDRYRRCIEAEALIHEEVEFERVNGKGWLYCTVVPAFDKGRIYRLICIERDITELKRTERKLHESRLQLRGLSARREEARESERKHIAREVHDELGQVLTALKLQLSVLDEPQALAAEEYRRHYLATNELLSRALRVVRNIASSLRPTALDMGIVSALEWLAGNVGMYSGLMVKVEIPNEKLFQLSENRAVALFRIAQESLTNVVKHAHADLVIIRLERKTDSYILTIKDNGIGFDQNKNKRESYGLIGIAERARMLGGKLRIDSEINAGTEIRVKIPIHELEGV